MGRIMVSGKWLRHQTNVLLAVGAILFWIISVFIPSNHLDVTRSAPVSLTSTSVAVPLAGQISESIARSESQGVSFNFRFKATQIREGIHLLRLNSTKNPLFILFGNNDDGSHPLLLQTVLTSGSDFSAILASNVAVDRTYNISFSILSSAQIEGSVNGANQFQFSYRKPSFSTNFTSFVLGNNQKVSGFNGEISNLIVRNENMREFRDPLKGVLRISTIVIIGLIAVESLVRLLSRFVRRTRGEASYFSLELMRLRNFFRSRQIYVGAILILVGVFGFATITPSGADNGSQTGFQILSLPGARPGNSTGVDIGSEMKSFAKSPSIDLTISAQVKVNSFKNLKKNHIAYLLNAYSGASGGAIILTSKGELLGAIGVKGAFPAFSVFEQKVPTHTWLALTLEVERNQTYKLLVNGQIVSTYTFPTSSLDAAPGNLVIGAQGSPPFDGSIRYASESVTLYSSNHTSDLLFLRTRGEILCGILIGLGVIVLSRRFLSTLVPVATDSKRPLVLIALGTTGVLTYINVFIDTLHLQSAPSPGVPRSTWLFISNVRFTDFYQTFELLKSGNPYGPQQGSYPPFGYLVLGPLAWMNQVAAFYVVLALFSGFLIWWSLRVFGPQLRIWERVGVLVIIGLSLPVTFVVDRGNIVMLGFLMLVIGTAAIEAKWDRIGAISLGFFAAIKVFPALYLLVFLRNRKWRPIAIGLAIALGLSLISFLSFDGSLVQNIDGFRRALRSLEKGYDSGQSSTYYNSTIYGWLQAVGYVFHGLNGAESVRHFIRGFVLPIEILSGVVLAWYIQNRETTLWRVVSLITIWLLLFPDVTSYYELLYLLVPLAFFVRLAPITRRNLWISFLFGISIAPKAYFYLGVSSIDVSVLLTAPILATLALLIVRDGIHDRRVFEIDPDYYQNKSIGLLSRR